MDIGKKNEDTLLRTDALQDDPAMELTEKSRRAGYVVQKVGAGDSSVMGTLFADGDREQLQDLIERLYVLSSKGETGAIRDTALDAADWLERLRDAVEDLS